MAPTLIRFAVHLKDPLQFAWFVPYVRFMGGEIFRPQDTRGERPQGAPAWDHWVRVGVEAPAALAAQIIRQLPSEAKAEHDYQTHEPTDLITD